MLKSILLNYFESYYYYNSIYYCYYYSFDSLAHYFLLSFSTLLIIRIIFILFFSSIHLIRLIVSYLVKFGLLNSGYYSLCFDYTFDFELFVYYYLNIEVDFEYIDIADANFEFVSDHLYFLLD